MRTVQILLLWSEHYEERRDDERYYGSKGLDPALVPDIVRLAHDEGLRVAAHVETAADFRCAIEGGVDLIAHTPGYGAGEGDDLESFSLTAADARRARELGVVQMTTCSVAHGPVATAVLRDNLVRLRDAGVPIIIGSDGWTNALELERKALVGMDVFEPVELLRAWCELTPRVLYPERKIGSLEPGHEGSLVALAGDPLEDPEHLGAVRLVVKRGRVVWRRDTGE